MAAPIWHPKVSELCHKEMTNYRLMFESNYLGVIAAEFVLIRSHPADVPADLCL
jgi:hypothetical protein